jgi:hypothetical protein
MNLNQIFNSPLECIDVERVLDILESEAFIAAAEIEGPNSIEFTGSKEKIFDAYVSNFYHQLALKIFEHDPVIKQFGPLIRIVAYYRLEVKYEEWTAAEVGDSIEVLLTEARRLRMLAIENELKGAKDGKGPGC